MNKYPHRLSILLSALIISSANAADSPQFQNVSTSSGIPLITTNGEYGIAWIDYNNDGYQDLVSSNRLFKNNGINGGFTELPTSLTGLSPGLGIAVGDYNGDGFDDIVITRQGTNLLYKNNNGDGSFSDVSSDTGILNLTQQSSSAAFADVNGDGYLDLYISNTFNSTGVGNSCGSIESANVLYINTPSASNSTGRIFIATNLGLNDQGCTWAAQAVDYDLDGDLDMVVVNDVLHPGNIGVLPETEIYHNQLKETGTATFIPASDQINLSGVVAGMGSTSADFNGDGFFDFYFTEIGSGVLALSNNAATYTTSQLSSLVDNVNVSWGASALDANNDGLMDLYVANSNNHFNGGGGSTNSFYVNNGNANFTRLTNEIGLASREAGVNSAIADYDNDGDMDVVVRGHKGAINLFENTTVTQNKSFSINLVGELPNKRAIGALVTVKLSNGANLIHQVQSGTSLGASDAFQVLFGLGSESVISTTIQWPGDCSQTISEPLAAIELEEWKCGLANGVAGTITSTTGDIISGATVSAIDPWNGTLYGSATTDDLGRYHIPVEVCICNMSATKVGQSIAWNAVGPGGQNWAWINRQLTMGDFTSTRTGGTVSGFAIGSNGSPVAGVTISGSNQNASKTFSVTTDTNGFYAVAVADDTYYIQGAQSADCSSFSPEGGGFVAQLISINFNDKTKNVICQP